MSLGLDYTDYSYRAVTMADAEMMLEWRNSDPVRDGMLHSRSFTMEEQVPWLQRCIESEQRFYYIFHYRGRPSGFFGIYDLNPEQKVGEWVYFMGTPHPDLPRGSGAAMHFIALDAFFGIHEIRRLWARTIRTNERACRMYPRFGFQLEGVLREHVLKDGQLIDLLCFGLLADEWECRRIEQFGEIFDAKGAASPPRFPILMPENP